MAWLLGDRRETFRTITQLVTMRVATIITKIKYLPPGEGVEGGAPSQAGPFLPLLLLGGLEVSGWTPTQPSHLVFFVSSGIHRCSPPPCCFPPISAALCPVTPAP